MMKEGLFEVALDVRRVSDIGWVMMKEGQCEVVLKVRRVSDIGMGYDEGGTV